MKILTWVLVVFSGIAVLGMITEPVGENTVAGLLYAGLVITQGAMVLNHLKKENL